MQTCFQSRSIACKPAKCAALLRGNGVSGGSPSRRRAREVAGKTVAPMLGKFSYSERLAGITGPQGKRPRSAGVCLLVVTRHCKHVCNHIRDYVVNQEA